MANAPAINTLPAAASVAGRLLNSSRGGKVVPFSIVDRCIGRTPAMGASLFTSRLRRGRCPTAVPPQQATIPTLQKAVGVEQVRVFCKW
jgi:hypothetical protein